MTDLRVAHLSDTHIGYEAYKTLSAGGENQRSVDIARAFVAAVDDIISTDPALVIHSGDVADRTVIPIRLMLLIRAQIAKLASIRPDGTRRQVVIVAGNHELPRNRKEACFLELLRGLPGVHVATGSYEVIGFPGSDISELRHDSLADVLIHALPHDALKTVEFDDVRPVDGKINILSSHGVAGGSELYVRSLGREFAIPTDVLARDWEYGALGHWHRQGPVPIAASGAKTRARLKSEAAAHQHDPLSGSDSCCSGGADQVDTNGEIGRIWYAGSTENCGFGDLKDNGTRRGWLDVTVKQGEMPSVTRRHLPIRAMFRLPHLDGSSMSPEEITEALITNIRATPVNGAVVGQVVDGVSRDVWSLVDIRRVREAAGDALHYEVALRPVKVEAAGQSTEHRGLAEAAAVLAERAALKITDPAQREATVAFATDLLTRQLERVDREKDAAKVASGAAVESDLTDPANTPDLFAGSENSNHEVSA